MAHKTIFNLLSVLAFIGLSSFAQYDAINTDRVTKPEQLKQLQEQRRNAKINSGTVGREFFTVLLRFSDDKDQADAVKNRFEKQFEGKYPCEIVWHEPKFKVFAGKFITRAEAVALLHKTRIAYPNAMIVTNIF